jgi:hypothetical protein
LPLKEHDSSKIADEENQKPSNNGRIAFSDISNKKNTEVKQGSKTVKRKLYTEGFEATVVPLNDDIILIDDESDDELPKVPTQEAKTPSSRRKSFHKEVRKDFKKEDDITIIDDEYDEDLPTSGPTQELETPRNPKDICQCPCCNVSIAIEKINEHLDQCFA